MKGRKGSCNCECLRRILRVKGECQPNFWFYEICSCWFYSMLFRIKVGKLLLLLKAGGDGDDRGWDGWITSPTQWTWVWANSRDGEGQGSLACYSPWDPKESMGSDFQNVGHDWMTEQQEGKLLLVHWMLGNPRALHFHSKINHGVHHQITSPYQMRCGLPQWLMVKTLPANAGDTGLTSGLGRSLAEGNGNPLQFSCLEDPMDRGAWRATVHGVPTGLDTT